MAATASRTGSKLALIVIGAFAVSLLLVPKAQSQEALRRSQQQQLRQQRQQRQQRALGASPYRDPYQRNISRNPFRDRFEPVGEVPAAPETTVQRFRRGVEFFR
ncbi:MAG: hypothetical protein AAF974_10095 [Cyanobacteria bacterium P01_E01_bin.34]